MDKSSLIYKTKGEIVLEDIRRDIMQEIYSGGEKLPTEKKLCEVYNASRITIGRALSSLEHEGLLTRKTSAGTTVLDRKDRKATLRLAGLMMLAEGHNYGKLHTLMTRKIHDNYYYPVLADFYPEFDTPERKSKLANMVQGLIDASPDFFAIDGAIEFPFGTLKKISDSINNLIFFFHFESDISFNASFILSDFEQGGYLGTKHLIDVGCQNILFCMDRVAHITKTYTHYAKVLTGAQKALAEKRLTFNNDLIFC